MIARSRGERQVGREHGVVQDVEAQDRPSGQGGRSDGGRHQGDLARAHHCDDREPDETVGPVPVTSQPDGPTDHSGPCHQQGCEVPGCGVRAVEQEELAVNGGRHPVDHQVDRPQAVGPPEVHAACVVDGGGALGEHPVDPVVVPGVATVAGHDLPRRGRADVRADAAAGAALVGDGGGRVLVAFDRPAAPEPQVGPSSDAVTGFVVGNDHGVASRYLQVEERVPADDVQLRAVG